MRRKGLAGVGMVAMFVIGLALTGIVSGLAGGVGTTTNAIPAFANIDPPRMFQLQARFIF